MKPRLKLHTSGAVTLISAGSNAWDERGARKWIRLHYGSLQAFAMLFNFPYGAVLNAVSHPRYERTAGPVANVRQLLGLKSNPTKHSINLSNAQRGRRAEAFAPPKSGRSPVRPSEWLGMVRGTQYIGLDS